MNATRRKAGAAVLAGVVLAGLGAWRLGWLGRAEEPALPQSRIDPDQETGGKIPGPGHAPPENLLARTMARLHRTALAKFHSDPRNGLSRMPVIYELVEKKWPDPWFSPGEIDRTEPVPEKLAARKPDLMRIHLEGTRDYLTVRTEEPKVEGVRGVFLLNRGNTAVNFPERNWESRRVEMIGWMLAGEPVAYLPKVDARGEAVAATRKLDAFELVALEVLREGQDLFVREKDGIVRMLGAVRADATCAKCHADTKTGDLLGAFSYTLREAEYRRTGGWPRPPEKKSTP